MYFMNEHQVHILGSKLDLFNREEVFALLRQRLAERKQTHVITLNPEICLYALRHEGYQKFLNRSDLTVADGIGLRFAALILGIKRTKRVTGRMVIDMLCRIAVEDGKSIYLLGAGEGVAEKTAKALQSRYVSLRIAGAEAGPASDAFVMKDGALQKRIHASGADIVFVAFGAPKQEQWIAANRSDLSNVSVFVGVGGLFDYEAGAVPRPPLFVQKAGLEWLYRLLTQPRRFTRIWRATVVFLLTALIWKFRILFNFRRNVVAMIVAADRSRVLVASPWWSDDIRWQFPQGGIDRAETAEDAVFREMSEELGTDDFKVLAHLPRAHQYIWPRWYRFVKGYRGQIQDLFILSFTGTDDQFQLGKTNELKRWQWVPIEKVVEILAPSRRVIGSLAVDAFRRLSGQAKR